MTYWLYGWHSVVQALQNPHRDIKQLLCTAEAAQKLPPISDKIATEIVDRSVLDKRLLPKKAKPDAGKVVHQGVALLVEPLATPHLEDLAAETNLLIILDQVTDPHNIGAIMRSAAAFGAGGVVVQDRHTPGENGVLAKAASGGLEHVPLVEVVNLSRSINKLQELGYWMSAFDSDAEQALSAKAFDTEKRALVFGAEGKGVRPLVLQQCDQLLRLPTKPPIASLNVSNAVAVSLFAAMQ